MATGSDKRAEHMARRKSQGLTYAEVAREFGTSKSSAHRKVSGRGQPKEGATAEMMRRGYTKAD